MEHRKTASEFFPQAKDWPPPGQQKTITIEEALKAKKTQVQKNEPKNTNI